MSLAQMIHNEVTLDEPENQHRFERRRRGAVRRGAVFEVSLRLGINLNRTQTIFLETS